MPRLTWLLAGAVSLTAGCSGVNWRRSLDSAMTEAAESRKRVLVEFHHALNDDCRKMDREVFTDPEVEDLLDRHFVPVRLDSVVHRERARQLGVQVYPTFFVLRPDGTVAGSRAGRLDTDRLRAFLIYHLSY